MECTVVKCSYGQCPRRLKACVVMHFVRYSVVKYINVIYSTETSGEFSKCSSLAHTYAFRRRAGSYFSFSNFITNQSTPAHEGPSHGSNTSHPATYISTSTIFHNPLLIPLSLSVSVGCYLSFDVGCRHYYYCPKNSVRIGQSQFNDLVKEQWVLRTTTRNTSVAMKPANVLWCHQNSPSVRCSFQTGVVGFPTPGSDTFVSSAMQSIFISPCSKYLYLHSHTAAKFRGGNF
jgi:hypothetical protein